MKLWNAFEGVLTRVLYAIRLAFLPTSWAIIRNPLLLVQPRQISAIFMSHVWAVYGDELDAAAREVKTMLITPNASGVVLEIGAGNGHTANYLNQKEVTRYVAIEPNELMHASIRHHANEAGFYESDSTLTILGCGAEDISAILRALEPGHASLQAQQPVDTIISFLSLCTIPRPKETLNRLVRDVLKSGGNFITYEHVRNHRPDVAWWQSFWAPILALAFGGCRMDRPSDVWVRELVLEENGHGNRVLEHNENPESAWRQTKLWQEEGEMEEQLFWRTGGVFTKRS